MSTPCPPLVLIGGSTGGVHALLGVLPHLPSRLRAAVVVVLHLPPERPSLVVDLFAPMCHLPVREPDDKEAIQAGTIYFAPPNYHLLIEPEGHFALSVDAPVNFSRPSIDALFESAAASLPGVLLIGVILSGASRDGVRGAEALALAGAQVWVQDPDSAEASLMPRAVATDVCGASPMALAQIAPALTHVFGQEPAKELP